jgi:hypothetical protein
MWLGVLVSVLAGVPMLPSPASSQTLREDLWVTDGSVEAVAVANGAIYLGGSFTRVSPMLGSAALVDAATGAAIAPYSGIQGVVMAVSPDVNGGWYIGGSFTEVGGEPRNNLAQLDAAGNLTAWDPGANGTVRALAINGSTVYAGGDFTVAGGQTRHYIAAFDGTTGSPTSWNPDADWVVNALVVRGSTVYAGGGFHWIGGQLRTCIAALDAATGSATSWAPNADLDVVALAVGSSAVYAGGYFTTIGGQVRAGIAAVDLATGAATAWAPSSDGNVLALAVHEASTFPFTVTVYAGGYFSEIAGAARSNIAAIDGGTGAATNWNPGADGGVNALLVKTNRFGSVTSIYAGGAFWTIGNQSRRYIAELTPAGAVTSWNPSANEAVFALAMGLGTIHVGGVFTSIGGTPRNNLAALDASSGALTGWDPNSSGPVHALAVSAGTVYAGGTFSSIGGSTTAINLAALDATTGLVLPSWDGDAYQPGNVYDFVLHGSTLYVGGDFTILGGFPRNRLGALDAATGAATSWDPGADGAVYALAVAERQTFPFHVTVYAGGQFGVLGGQPRVSIGAVDGSTGAATSWNPSASSDVYDIELTTDFLGNVTSAHVAGLFWTIGGQTRHYIAELDAGGSATSWSPNAGNVVYTLARSGGVMYAGGSFASIGGQARSGLAALDVVTGAATAWNPDALGTVKALTLADAAVYVGGAFGSIGGGARPNFAGFYEAAVGAPEQLPGRLAARVDAAPNPFRSDVTLSFALPEPADTSIEIYDVAGRLVRTLRGARISGAQRVRWDGRDEGGRGVATGVYLVRVQSRAQDLSAKVLRVR